MKVIKGQNGKARLPLLSTIVAALALSYWHAPEWLWGAVGFFFLVIWVACIVVSVQEEEVDVIAEIEALKKKIK